jgi:hypothetical protein
MVEKTDAGRDLARAGAVEIDAALDPRFLGVAFDRRDAHRNSPDVWATTGAASAATNRAGLSRALF